jgi:chromosome segregation ATPase
MTTEFTLEQLSDFVAESISRIGLARKELEEVQTGFNSAYVEWKAEHDATLARLAQTLRDRWDGIGPELQQQVLHRVADESQQIDDRHEELRSTTIAQVQQEADEHLDRHKQLEITLRELNPRLDDREERLKQDRAGLQSELKELNRQIRRLSGCLGVVFNFVRITRLDKERQRVLGKLESVEEQLRDVRQEWESARTEVVEDRRALQASWQEAMVRLAELKAELGRLDVEENRETLALERAIFHVVDTLKQPVDCPESDLKQELDRMAQFNIRTDDYQAGLGSVAGYLSLLDGITEGLKRLQDSVNGLADEQRMHSAYLPQLRVSLPADIVKFHQQWDALAAAVRDDSHLADHPSEFRTQMQPLVDEELAEPRIQAMFDGLGEALQQATQEWR